MNLNLKKYFNELLVVPLGGTDEIGMNLYVYHFKGKWLIVDMGLGFANDYYPGVDLIVPDISFLKQIKKNIVGIVITHAHEDHIGAIQYLWPQLELPIYTTKFTASVIKTKLANCEYSNAVKIHIIKPDSRFNVDPFSLEFVSLTHSVPEMQALVIHDLPGGSVLHSGDWKFDKNPLIGKKSNLKRLKELGNEKVLAMLCDSTNIFSEGRAGSEGDLQKSLNDLVAGFKNRLIIIATFASNIARLYSIMLAAKNSNRKVVLSGTSLWRMYNAAKECGYLNEDLISAPIHPKQFIKYKRSDLVVIATGCQGERLASMNKLANMEHPDIKLSTNDAVIFTSKIIPGNETKIFSIFNKLSKNGIEVLTEKDHFVHVSGHPCRDEVEEMYKLVKPKYAIPMHGEPMHTHEHVKFIKQKKLAHPLQIENGSLTLISENKIEILGKVDTGYMAVDGNFILPSNSEILKYRRHMRDNGLVIVTIVINDKKLKNVEILAPGVLDSNDDLEYFDKIKLELQNYLKNSNLKLNVEVQNKLRSMIKRFFKHEIGKEPKILLQILSDSKE